MNGSTVYEEKQVINRERYCRNNEIMRERQGKKNASKSINWRDQGEENNNDNLLTKMESLNNYDGAKKE